MLFPTDTGHCYTTTSCLHTLVRRRTAYLFTARLTISAVSSPPLVTTSSRYYACIFHTDSLEARGFVSAYTRTQDPSPVYRLKCKTARVQHVIIFLSEIENLAEPIDVGSNGHLQNTSLHWVLVSVSSLSIAKRVLTVCRSTAAAITGKNSSLLNRLPRFSVRPL